MKNKEIVKILGLSAALSMTACNGRVAEVVPVDSVAEVAEAEEEPSTTEEPTPTPTAAPTPTASPTPEVQESDIEVTTPDYTIEPMEETTYYAIQQCNVRSGPSTSYDTVRQLAPNEAIIVNGKVKAENGKAWCVIKTEDDSTQMVSASLISTEKIATKKPSSGNSGNSGSTKPSTGTTNPAPSPSDCVVADCAGDCEGDCSFTDCGFAFCDDCCVEYVDCCGIAAE